MTLPHWLSSTEAFAEFLQTSLDGLSTSDKGDRFNNFAVDALRIIEPKYRGVIANPKKSSEKGIDFFIQGTHGYALAGQSKLSISRVEDINGILERFEQHEQSYTIGADLLSKLEADRCLFVICTASKIDSLLAKFRSENWSKRPFLERLEKDGRIEFYDRTNLFNIVKTAYDMSYGQPPSFEFTSKGGWLKRQGVHIGIVTSSQLRQFFEQHGTRIFFENVREFLTINEKEPGTPNASIFQTATTEPNRFLERNNGVTIKAARMDLQSSETVSVVDATIVNGCQTTMCLVRAREASSEAEVLVKIIETSDAWPIAKSSNHQNRVTTIELDLARFFRRQLVEKAAIGLGYAVNKGVSSESPNIVSLVSWAAHIEVDYDEVKSFVLGVFSRSPNNVMRNNYERVDEALLAHFASLPTSLDKVMKIALRLVIHARKANEKAQERFTGDGIEIKPIMRVFDQEKPQHRVMLSIYAAAALFDMAFWKLEGNQRINSQEVFFEYLEHLLLNDPAMFDEAYKQTIGNILERVLEKDTLDEQRNALSNELSANADDRFKKLRVRFSTANLPRYQIA